MKIKNNEIRQNKHKPDSIILVLVFALLVFGLIMISSAGVVISKTRFNNEYYFFNHQLFYGVIPGLVALFIVQKIHYSFWKKMAVPMFFGSLILLILVFIPSFGIRLQGASRWINLGPISFQPTEIMKLSLVLYLAYWIEARGNKVKNFYEGLIPFLVVVGVVSFLVISQPDFGTLGGIIAISITMFFVSGVPLKYLFGIGIGGLSLGFLLVKLEPYRMNRLITFFDPTADPQGIGYQINQALLAIGSGGIFGLGLGHSRQKFNYLPEPVGDSIFAVVAEELGMIGASILVCVFLLLVLRGFKIAQNAPDKFAKLVAFGISSWIIFQALINIMAIVGLIPLTGIPLPFISYGSTSLVFLLVGVGILVNISKYTKA